MNNRPSISEQISKIRDHIAAIKQAHGISQEIKILAVTKSASFDQAREIFHAGLSVFGENRVQDALPKMQALSDLDIEWRFIGRVQSNKLNKILSHFSVIQSVDSLDLAGLIQRKSAALNRCTPIFLQFNGAEDPQKAGFSILELAKNLAEISLYPNVCVVGIMTFGPNPSDPQGVWDCFRRARLVFDELRTRFPSLTDLSMGMSNDYPQAIAAGATQVRIGTLLLQ